MYWAAIEVIKTRYKVSIYRQNKFTPGTRILTPEIIMQGFRTKEAVKKKVKNVLNGKKVSFC